MKKTVIYLLGSFLLLAKSYGQNAALDKSFGTFGKVTTSVPHADSVRNMAQLSTGHIIAVGLTMIKYDPHGKIDSSFGTFGKVPNISMKVNVIKVLPDDRILLGGAALGSPSDLNFALSRYHSNGKIDSSFGVNGRVMYEASTAALSNHNDEILDIEILSNGKIFAGGYAYRNMGFGGDMPRGRLICLDSNGVVDTNYTVQLGAAGTNPNLWPYMATVHKIFSTKNNRVLICGSQCSGPSGTCGQTRAAIAAIIDSTGLRDNTYGQYPARVFHITSNTYKFHFAVDTAGGLRICSDRQVLGSHTFLDILSVKPNGFYDVTFSNYLGKRLILNEVNQTSPKILPVTQDFKLTDQNQIILCGKSNSNFFLLRLDAFGNPDSSCSWYKHTIDFDRKNDGAYALNLLPDGSFLLGGGSNENFALTKVLPVRNDQLSSLNYTACDSAQLFGQVFHHTSTHSLKVLSSQGCDSLIELNLTIAQADSAYHHMSTCDSYLFHGKTYNNSGRFSHTLKNVFGCDSVIDLDLVIYHSDSSTLIDEACDVYSFNGKDYNHTGVYTDTLQTIHGCDSVITLDLSLTKIDSSVLHSHDSLFAVDTSSSYQWIDCSNGERIQGATNQTFVAVQNGDYAVEITKGNCTETSACYSIRSVSNEGFLLSANEFKIYPNPNNGTFRIDLKQFHQLQSVQILNTLGQTIYQTIPENKSLEIGLNQPPGIYTLRVELKNGSLQTARLIVN